ncbi:MAG TPA: hypothetical protein VGI06_08550 [Acidimicrobiales bacterium]
MATRVPGQRGQPTVPLAVLSGWVVGSAAYGVAVSLLARWPAAVRSRGHGGAARPGELATATAVVVVGAVLLLAGRPRRPAVGLRAAVALGLLGFGAAWVAWGLVDQHVLRTFDLAVGSPWAGAWDGLFHGVGVMAAGVGTSLLTTDPRPTAGAEATAADPVP